VTFEKIIEKYTTYIVFPLLIKRKEKMIHNEKAVANTPLKPANSTPKIQKETNKKKCFEN